MLLGDYCRDWIDNRLDLRESTRSNYRNRMMQLSSLLDAPINEVSAALIRARYAEMYRSNYSPFVVRGVHLFLRSVLRDAMADGLVAENAADRIKTPRAESHGRDVWTPEHARTFLSATKKNPMHAVWFLLLSTGLRRGEVLALRWSDVDLERSTLSVSRTVTRSSAGWRVGDVKTRSSQRRVVLSRECCRLLLSLRERHRVLHGDEHAATGPVVSNDRGHAYQPASLNRMFSEATRSAGVPQIRLHDLRHTSATLMLINGEHPKIVSERLGHSSVSITLDLYSHSSLTLQHEAAGRLDQLIALEAGA